jgi:hypothetical protein
VNVPSALLHESGVTPRLRGLADFRDGPWEYADNENMRALSIRQPFAELILRGLKTIEYRSRPTKIIGQRFWIYASKGQAARGKGQAQRATAAIRSLTSDNLAVGDPPPWMIELANAMRLFPHELPTGVIVGSAIIEKCVLSAQPASSSRQSFSTSHSPPPTPFYEWHLTDIQRLPRPRKPHGHPQPVWFQPF